MIIVVIYSIAAVMLALLLVLLWMRLRSGSASSPNKIEEKLRLGQKYLSELDYDRAVAEFTDVIKIDDKTVEAYVGLGEAYSGKRDWTLAVGNYDKAVSTASAVVSSARADHQDKTGDIEETGQAGTISTDTEGLESAHAHYGDVVKYAEDDEWELLASFDTGGIKYVRGFVQEQIDGEYLADVVSARNEAVESGLMEIYESDGGYEEMEVFLAEISHPMYVPESEILVVFFPVNEESGTQTFDSKVRELISEYSAVPDEPDSFVADLGENNGDFIVPEDVLLRNRGLLFIDIHDYDGDGEEELLVFRRVPLQDTNQNGISRERSGFVAEMYEAENSGCVLADSMEIGVYDALYFAFGGVSVNIFRSDRESEVTLYVEAYISEQDHGPDDSIICFQYQDHAFTNFRGVRFGHWYSDDTYGVYFTPASEEAALHLSGWNGIDTENDSGWVIQERPVDYNYDRPLAAFKSGLDEIGLFMPDLRESVTPSGSDCFAPTAGTLTDLGQYVLQRNDAQSDWDNHLMTFDRSWTDYLDSLENYRDNSEETEEEPLDQSDEEVSEEEVSEEAGQEPDAGELTSLPDNASGDFIFSSGAGGWQTQITLNEDGTFSAHYSDSNLGPKEVYYCDFTGRFTNIRQINEYSYSMTLTDLEVQTDKDSEEVREDGFTWIGADPYGFTDGGSNYILYMPDTPASGLDGTFLSWVYPVHGIVGDYLDCVAIFDESGEGHYGFVKRSE